MRLVTIIVSIVCILTGFGGNTGVLYALDFSGYARSYLGILADEDNEYSMQQNTFDLRIEHSRSDVAFKVNPYIYTYHDRENEFDLRQSFIDIYLESTDIRVGKQQIVWGKADGVFITDIVSPKDLSNYILPEFEEIRIGVDALKTVTYFGNHSIEFVWIPTFTPTQFPDEESIWYVEPDLPLAYEVDLSKKEVKCKASNSEIFLKFSMLSSAVDFELIAGHFWDDQPTNHMVQVVDQTSHQPKLIITPEHHRLSMGGGSFSSSLGPVVIRGEAAYHSGKYFQSEDPSLEDHVVQKDYLHYLIGMDVSIAGIDVNLQLIQEQIMDYDEDIVQDREVNSSTLLVRRDFFRETLTTEIMFYHNYNFQDSLYRPKITYDFIDNVSIQLGANVFSGDEGPYGQYDENDNVFASLRYNF